MTEEDRITIKFPKGIKPKHLAIIVIFGLAIYYLSEALKSIFTSGLQNPNYALFAIAFILIVICLITVFVIRILSKEEGQRSD